MCVILLKDEYCTEELYKILSAKMKQNTILGISEYEYEIRKNIYSSLFPKLKINCCSSEEDYLELSSQDEFGEIYLSDALSESQELIEKLSEKKLNVKYVKDFFPPFNFCLNRLQFRKRKSLKELLKTKSFLRVIETTSAVSSLLLEQMVVKTEDGNEKKFDAFWISSLCDSLQRGRPDNEFASLTDRLNSFIWTKEISSLPAIFDFDSGGTTEHFVDGLITIYNMGISAVIIEDKIGKKINSLAKNCAQQSLDSAENFAEKIRCGRQFIDDDDFMIIARIESLNIGNGIDEAIYRARKYIEAKADAILIHYNKNDVNVIKKFCEEYNKLPNRKPLVVVPTTYSYVTEDELRKWGVNIVIYANHISRSMIPAIVNAGATILKNGRAIEASENCISVSSTLKLVVDDMSSFIS